FRVRLRFATAPRNDAHMISNFEVAQLGQFATTSASAESQRGDFDRSQIPPSSSRSLPQPSGCPLSKLRARTCRLLLRPGPKRCDDRNAWLRCSLADCYAALAFFDVRKQSVEGDSP